MKICEYCKKEHVGLFSSGRFCSRSCSNKFSCSKINKKKRKKLFCFICKKEINTSVFSSSKIYCEKCSKIRHKTKCNWCGLNICQKPDICKKHQLFKTLIKYFNFNETSIGTIEIYNEFEKIQKKLEYEYTILKLSSSDLAQKYNYYDSANFCGILTRLGIKRRNLSEAQINAIINGKNKFFSVSNPFPYKHGYHITWDGKQVFYRSNLELEMCKLLDQNKIKYLMESLRIKYLDSKLQKIKIAIPDFLLVDFNIIIECKGSYFYDKQNIKDRQISFEKLGFKFKLVLENQKINSIDELLVF